MANYFVIISDRKGRRNWYKNVQNMPTWWRETGLPWQSANHPRGAGIHKYLYYKKGDNCNHILHQYIVSLFIPIECNEYFKHARS